MRSVNLSCSPALDAAVAAIENTPSTMPRTLDQIRMTLRGNDDTGYAVVDADTGEVLAEGPLDKKAGISAGTPRRAPDALAAER